MIEVYGFLAVFALQVLALSVVYPAQFNKYVRKQAVFPPTASPASSPVSMSTSRSNDS